MTEIQTEIFVAAVIKQNRGPTLEFEGLLLCETEWNTSGRDAASMRLELWQTRGGALIPVTRTMPHEQGRRGLTSATVVGPIPHPGAMSTYDPAWDEQAMQFAVLDHFDWNDRARSMVREQLGWSLKRVVA